MIKGEKMCKGYTERLEDVIKQMLKPIKGIPLNLVIESISNCKVIPFDRNDAKNQKMLEVLKKAAENAGNDVNRNGIKRSRPNEVGNDIELFVQQALEKLGYKAYKPSTKSGKTKSTGYPDLEFIDEFERISYLECKTYNIDNIATTQRSFYLSPSEEFKITKDAFHFILSYEVVEEDNVYKTKAWKLLSIDKLDLDVKYEFNSDNKRMYSPSLILAEGEIAN
jgi:antitoxin component of RelBE/YafQ-DinJ toxin-antitoxin module